MMNSQNEKLRVLQAVFAARSSNKEWKKRIGEYAASIWLNQKSWDHFPINAEIYDKPESLTIIGGKRPDFCANINGEIIYLDAKFHACLEDEFYLEEFEIGQYVKWRDWVADELNDNGERDVIFMVFPHKDKATRFVFVHLDELIYGQSFMTSDGKPARKVSLHDRSDLTFKVEQ